MLRVDLEQFEVDLLPLGILLQCFLENFLCLRVATVGEIDLGFRDRVDLVGIDVPQALAAEIARERVVAGIDHTATGRTEDGVGLDIRPGDDAVLELGRRAAAGSKQTGDERQYAEHRGSDRPGRRVAEDIVEERGFCLGPLRGRRGNLGCGRLCFGRLRFRCLRLRYGGLCHLALGCRNYRR